MDLVGLSKGEGRIDVLGVIEGINGFLVQASSGDARTEGLHDRVSYGSLVPEDSTGVGDRKGVIGSRIGVSGNDTDVKGLGYLGYVSYSCGITGFARVSSDREESYGTKYGEDRDDDDKLDEGETLGKEVSLYFL